MNFIETYFTEEKIQFLFLIIIGIIAITLACIFLFIIKYSFFKGMAISLLLIGTFQVIIGSVIYNRSSSNIVRVNTIMNDDPQKIKIEELPRIENVIKKITIYKWIEIAIFIISIILFYKSPLTFWKGLALGIMIQASIFFTLDIIAEKRSEVYMNNLIEKN